MGGNTVYPLLAHPEVGQLAVPVRVEQDVVELQVAVDDAVRVQELQRQRHLGGVEPGQTVHTRSSPLGLHDGDTMEHAQRHVELPSRAKADI